MERDIITKVKELQLRNNVCSIIASYFLSLDANDIEKIRIKDVEKTCHVSSPSVMRFCKECGFDSFSRFKFALVQRMNIDKENLNISSKYEFNQPFSYKAIVDDTISKTALCLTEERLNNILDALNKYHEIVIFAGGSTFFVAEDFERKLIKVGKHAFAYNDDYWMRFSITNAQKDTLFVGISYSGSTKNVINNLKQAKELGYKTVLLTSVKNNHLESEMDLLLYVSSSETRDRLVNTSSRIAMLFLIDAVYYAYISKYYPEYFEKYKELRA